MVFEDKFEYLHSNEKNILENSSLALANTGTEETEGLVGVGLTPRPSLHVLRWWKKRRKKQEVGSLFITMDMVYSFPAKYLSLEQLCLFTLSIPLRHISRSPYGMLTLKASGYQPSPPPSPLHHSKPCFAVNERAALKGLSKSNVSAKFSLILAISR